jgi:hypothetical protein
MHFTVPLLSKNYIIAFAIFIVSFSRIPDQNNQGSVLLFLQIEEFNNMLY